MSTVDCRAFPAIPLTDFDRYAHSFSGGFDKHWDEEIFPFEYTKLPRLPEIHNPVYALRACTHQSLPTSLDPDCDALAESYQAFETVGDAVLNQAATLAVYQAGCDKVSADINWIREKLICNGTLGYLGWAYRIHLPLRHMKQVTYPAQKLLADLFEAYIGAVYIDSIDRGEPTLVHDWLKQLYTPSNWTKWATYRDELLKEGPAKRLQKFKVAMEARVRRDAKRESKEQDKVRKRPRILPFDSPNAYSSE